MEEQVGNVRRREEEASDDGVGMELVELFQSLALVWV